MKSGNYCILCTDQNNLQNNWHYLKMKSIFMNRENSKTSKPHRFRLDLTDKIDLNKDKKNMDLANLSIYYTWINIKSTTINLKFRHQLGMILLIYLIVLILSRTFRIILNLSSKNTKLWLKIRQFKFTKIKSKTELLSK